MMTRVQLNRLQKLHDFVEKEVAPKYFDMRFYRGEKQGGVVEPLANTEVTLDAVKGHTCGTHGCLMGWTPFVFTAGLRREKLLSNNGMYFSSAAEYLFGIRARDPEWDYLFESAWGKEGLSGAKQKKAALKRIRNMIASKGGLTEEMKDEMRRHGLYVPGWR